MLLLEPQDQNISYFVEGSVSVKSDDSSFPLGALSVAILIKIYNYQYFGHRLQYRLTR